MPPYLLHLSTLFIRFISIAIENHFCSLKKYFQSLSKLDLLRRAFMLNSLCTLNHTFIEPRACMNEFEWKANDSSGVALKKFKRDSVYIDKNGKLRDFNHKKMSRKRCGSLRGRGWKFGSGFVDGIFPVLSPTAKQILDYLQKVVDSESIWGSLDMLPASHDTWDDVFTVAVQLRMRKQWDSIISICRWILFRSSFKPDIICYNLLIDAFGQKFQYKEAEATYLQLVGARCIPTEDTYALLIKAYCMSGLLEKAEAVFAEMRSYGFPSSMFLNQLVHPYMPKDKNDKSFGTYINAEKICQSHSYASVFQGLELGILYNEMNKSGAVVYNAYMNGLMKGGNPNKAEEIFQRMKRDGCVPSNETYTMLINLYGKAGKSYTALKVFNEMLSHKCKPNICTYTALVNAFAREGLCEKAEEVFEQMQEAGIEPDVYAYNALMEAYSRAGYPYGAAEIFSLMQHMGCEPDRASYNILVDAYGRAGFQDDAEAVFEDMKRVGITPTMKSHMVLLSAYSKMGSVSKCEDLVNQICKSGLKLDTYVLNSMLNLYGRLGQFEKMEEVLTVMEKGSYVADVSTYNILINRYGQAGFIDRMEELFHLLHGKGLKPDVVTWTSRIGAYSKKKLYVRCIELFEGMIDAGCYPDGGTVKVLLAACSNEDQTEQVTTVIRTMHKDMKPVLAV